MDTRLSDAERIHKIATQLLAEQRKYARFQEKSCGDLNPKQAQKASTDLNWQAFHLVKIESELHAACVDASLAEERDAGHYAPRSIKFDGWHEYMFHPALPARLKKAAG